MNRIKLHQDIKPLSDFRANAAAAINHVQESRRAMVITKRGYSAAVILDVATYESMVEELDQFRATSHDYVPAD